MSSKALALENFWVPGFFKAKKYITNSKQQSQPRFWLAVGLIAINTFLLMSYIYGVNDYANKGYQIKALQTQLASLTDANNKINLTVSEASSMVSIQTDFLNANFVQAGTPIFIQPEQFTER
jgi:hypothetical protein